MTVSEKLANLVGNPLEWRSTSKALLLQGLSLLMHVQYTWWGYYLFSLDEREQLVNVANLEVLLGHFHVLVSLTTFFFLAMLLLRKRLADSVWLEYFAASYYGLSLCYFSYTIGTMTLPTGAALAGTPVVGFILFNRTAVMVALALSLVALIGSSYAAAAGWLPYAPILQTALGANGELSMFW